MRKFRYIVLLCSLAMVVCAQTVQLHWQPVITLTADSDTMHAIALEQGVYIRCSVLPSLVMELPAAGQVTLEQVALEPLTTEELAIAEQYRNVIPAELSYDIYTQTCRKQTSHRLEVFPFVLQNDVIQKVQSFAIQTTARTQAPVATKKATYTTNSILKKGKFIKIAVDQNGIYKLTYEELSNMGIDPKNVRIFGYGGAMLAEDFSKPYLDDLPEVAIYEYRGNDGVFGSGDYILFYGQGPTSWAYYSYGLFRHTQNVYSNYGYYFVTSDAGTGKRIALAEPISGEPTGTITSFTDYMVHERDLVNLIQSGREFYGEEFSTDKTSYSFSCSMPNMLAEQASFRLDVAAHSQQIGSINTTMNGQAVGNLATPSLQGSPTYEYAKTATTTPAFYFTPQAANTCNINLAFENTSGSVWLNFFELNVKRQLKLVDNAPLFFRNIDSIGESLLQQFVIENTTSATQVWDVTDKQNIKQLTTTFADGKTTFADSVPTLKEYVAVNPAAGTFLSPVVVGQVSNQNLHALPQMDMLILAPAEFLEEAERLAEAHREIQGLNVQVVDVAQVYNEFSSGTPDATAYRRLMKLFYDRATNEDEMPRYLLLFGDGVYDNRKIVIKEDYNKLLTFQSYNSVHGTDSYVCDDYFSFLDDDEGVNITRDGMDIGVGRFPVYTDEQAQIAVDKAITYLENSTLGEWKNQIVFISDDGDNNQHIRSCDSVADMTLHNYPDMLVRKLFLDAYQQEVSASGESYPLAIELFDNYIKNGTLMLNYMGHGGHTAWANEGVLTHDRIVNMYNDKYPLFVTATCDFSRFDDNGTPSGGELLLLNEHGGAIALFTTTRTVYAEPNFRLNLQFAKYIFSRDGNGAPICFGDVMRNAKNALGTDANKMNFTLLGDPALALAYPATHHVVTDSITLANDENLAQDTIKALSKVRIYGHLEDEFTPGIIATNFNGYTCINVFDKTEKVTTLCNDATETKDNVPYTFTDRTNALFIGKSRIKNGQFVTEFMVPKDIRYNYGSGRIVYYAVDTTNNYEANGYYEKFIVGGEDKNVEPDDEGPKITAYLNTPLFRSGDQTDASPLFVASVSDDCGINAIGSGIGHDIMLRLDNDPKLETTLNSYFTTNMDEYRSGTIKYQFSNLAEGKHHLLFRVWDLQNNSATAELDFEVVNGLAPSLADMYVYPNPASTSCTFVYVHDRPEQPLKVTATVSDLAGRIIYTGAQTVITYDNRTEIVWDFAGQISPGIYIVRMAVQVEGGEITTKTTKLMVKKQ